MMESGMESRMSTNGTFWKCDKSLIELGNCSFGCSHYRRRCKIRAPCCNEIFDCRHCHNEAKNSLDVDPLLRHDIPRHDLKKVICSLCGMEQDVRQHCIQCGVCMGKYFCVKCKFFDDDVSKKQYHCNECGICRVGGEENFFHCNKCGCCYSKLMKDSHNCVEKAMHHNCPVCFELSRDISSMVDQKHEKKVGVMNPAEIKFGGRKYYRYLGSLTVPPCTEGVIWTMNKKIRTVSKEQVKLLREAVHDYAEFNARPLQPLNSREIHLYRPTKRTEG